MCKPTTTSAGNKVELQHTYDVLPNDTAIQTKSSNNKNAKSKLQKGTLCACISLGLLISAFSLLMPYVQSRRDELQCDTMCYGAMTSVRSTLSLIGSAFMGKLSDTKKISKFGGNGRIFCLYVGTFAALLGMIIDATTFSIRGLWLSMIPGALLQQNFSIYKALMADYYEEIACLEHKRDDEEEEDSTRKPQDASSSSKPSSLTTTSATERAASVGKLGMTVGLSFMVGPLLGTTIVKTFQGAVLISICLTLLSTIGIYKMPVPMTTMMVDDTQNSSSSISTSSKQDSKKETFKNQLFQFVNVKSAKTKPAILLIIIRSCMALAYHVFSTIWTVSLKRRFQNFGPSDHGKFMSYIGLVFALSQGYVAKLVLSPFGKPLSNKGRTRVILLCCLFLGVGRVIAFQTTDIKIVYLMFGFIVTSLGVVNTIFAADTCLIAPSSDIGGLYGILEASQNAAGMIGPFASGVLASVSEVNAPLTAVVALYTFVFIIVFIGYDSLILSNKNNKKGLGDDGTIKKDA
mmetsp:Transcript_2331/g.2800  ORF Transcript_2331/g.2800 Transcript_2331/m.2800 type:complete len:518 (-) Transcript_2331:218-1771(-)